MPDSLSLPNLSWATGGGAAITEPLAPRKALGWVPAVDIPPAEHVNWLFNACYQWIDAVAGAAGYSALQTAITDLSTITGVPIERTFVLDESDDDQIPGAILAHAEVLGAAGDPVAITGDGTRIFVASAGSSDIAIINRATLATLATLTYTVPGDVREMVTDGEVLALITDDATGPVEVLDIAGAASLWDDTHGGSVFGVALDASRVYVGGNDVAGVSVRAFVKATGVSAWDYDHGANVKQVAADGVRVFVYSSTASSHASGATLRAVLASSGADAAGEGGIATDATGTAWDGFASDVGAFNKMVCAAGWLAFTYTDVLEIRRGADGEIQATREIQDNTGAALGAICYLSGDHEQVSVSGLDVGGQQWTFSYSVPDLALRWRHYLPVATATRTYGVPFADGSGVFVVSDASDTTYQIIRHARLNRPGIWKRITPSTLTPKLRLLADPA